MAVDLVMPRMGATMTEGTVVRWLKEPGDAVQQDEPVVEIETDKSTVELTAPASGVLGEWLVQPGATVPIGRPLVVIGQGVPASAAAAKPKKEVRASPVARRLAREHGVNLAEVQPSGSSGRIVESDVQRVIDARGAAAAPPSRSTAAGRHHADQPGAGQPREAVETPSSVRRVTAERMAYSFSTAPHFYLHVEADASALVAWHQGSAAGEQPTYNDLLLWLVTRCLAAHPRVNASWQDGQVHRAADINLGVAVATDRGLVVPVIRQAQRLRLAEIGQQRQALVARARNGQLLPDDYTGGTFTVSNLGMYGIDSFNAILNPPQAAILAVGRLKERPFVVKGQLSVRVTLHLNLAADHRALDGAEAAQFLSDLASLIEAPQRLVA